MPNPLADLDVLEANTRATLAEIDRARATVPVSEPMLMLVLETARTCTVSALALVENFRLLAADAREAKAAAEQALAEMREAGFGSVPPKPN